MRTTFFAQKISSADMDSGPLLRMIPNEPWGIFSPTEIAILVVIFCDEYDEPVEFIRNFKLASQATTVLTLECGIQHAVFHIVHCR